MDKDRIIEMLRQDMREEHQAIIQYLSHAYALGEGEIPSDIEQVARDEMRHLDWLAEEIVELGGDPDMDREEPDLTLAPHSEQMLKDAELEQKSIDLYRSQMEVIDDPGLRRLLARIIHDELAHQDKFYGYAEELAEEGVEGPEGEALAEELPDEPEAAERLQEIINYGVRHEYTVILQYLYHSFVADECELSEEMEDTAINEMQHMGWLAEELQEKGVQPDYSHEEPFLSRDPVANLKADMAIEEEVTRVYSSQIPELHQEDLIKILTRIRDNEIYHDDVFRDLLQEAIERQAAREAQDGDNPPEPAKGAPFTADQDVAESGEDDQEQNKEVSRIPEAPSIGSLLGRAE